MQKISYLCMVFLALAMATPAYAYENDTQGNYAPVPGKPIAPDVAPPDDDAAEAHNDDYINHNSDGTERVGTQKDDAARRVMNGEGSSGPTGQEDMFPHNGKLH